MKRALWWGFLAVLLAGLTLTAGCTSEEEVESLEAFAADTMRVDDAWARPAPEGGTSAAYFTLINGTAAADTLNAVRTPVATDVEIHESYETEEGLSGMRAVGSIPVGSRERAALRPGGLHVMLIGVTQPLEEEDTLTLQLEFAEHETKTIAVPVRMEPPTSPD